MTPPKGPEEEHEMPGGAGPEGERELPRATGPGGEPGVADLLSEGGERLPRRRMARRTAGAERTSATKVGWACATRSAAIAAPSSRSWRSS